MNRKKRINQLEIYTNNERIINVLNEFKKNQKLYTRVLEALQLIGNFEEKSEVDLYEITDTDEKKKIKIWLTDIDGNIFILTPLTTSKLETSKIEKITNNDSVEYDLLLAKKFKLTSDNISLIKTGTKYDFKYGRLITDNESFYNIFLPDDKSYHISINFIDKSVSIKELLSKLNQLKSIPSFHDCTKIFENQIAEENLKYTTIEMAVFHNFETIGKISIDGNYPKIKKLN